MHQHTCLRCRDRFDAIVKIPDPVCQPCRNKRDPERLASEDTTPTKPGFRVPPSVFMAQTIGGAK